MGKKHTTKEINDAANQYFEKQSVLDAIKAEEKLSVKSYITYIEADAFLANPYSLLGRVIIIRKKGEKCPDGINEAGFTSEFAPLPIPGIVVDEASKINQPVKRGSLVVTKELASKVSFLNYLSAEIDTQTCFEIMVFDQTTGLVEVQSSTWQKGLNDWLMGNEYLMKDPNVCYLFAVVGIVQKNVIRKKFTKLDTSVKGGHFGVNINGEIHTSTDEFFLDIKFGLTPVILKSPTFQMELPKAELKRTMTLIDELKVPVHSMVDFHFKGPKKLNYTLANEKELKVFNSIIRITEAKKKMQKTDGELLPVP